ncbi:MAG: alkaline phosphatase D family protein [Sandaracinaceae bacterium]|nr:alkaline phosphatase D family protein [Sandaracinaceae bacterium]
MSRDVRMSLSRREWLQSTGAMGVVVASSQLLGCDDDKLPPLPSDLPTDPYTGPEGPATVFSHGVASGDPVADGFVIWTRVSPADLGTSVDVFYEVALDPEFVDRVVAGTMTTGASVDFTAKIDVRGLVWGRDYYYRFAALGRSSLVGRARCAPEGNEARALRFAVTSCASLGHGYFHAYRRIAEREDLDAVIHLGDYIYEYGTGEYGSVREYEPAHEIVTLADYRTRHAQYRRDPDLQALHQQHPLIPIWDDHESANDSYEDGAENHQPDSEGAWTDRKAAAKQAYFEWMPIRDAATHQVYRRLQYGNLLDIVLLDTRLEGREQQLEDADELEGEPASRSLLGATQEAWLSAELEASTARWVFLAQQVMVAQLSLSGGSPFNLDQWDGYPAARGRLLETIRTHANKRTVVLTGDIHTSWVSRLVEDPYAEGVDLDRDAPAVEFVTTSVTSPGIAAGNLADRIAQGIIDQSPHLEYVQLSRKGYVVMEVTAGTVYADYFFVEGVLPGEDAEEFAVGFDTRHGVADLVRRDTPRPTRPAPAPAPGP